MLGTSDCLLYLVHALHNTCRDVKDGWHAATMAQELIGRDYTNGDFTAYMMYRALW